MDVIIIKKSGRIKILLNSRTKKEILSFYKKRGYKVLRFPVKKDKMKQVFSCVVDYNTGNVLHKKSFNVPTSVKTITTPILVNFSKIYFISTKSFDNAISVAKQYRNRLVKNRGILHKNDIIEA